MSRYAFSVSAVLVLGGCNTSPAGEPAGESGNPVLQPGAIHGVMGRFGAQGGAESASDHMTLSDEVRDVQLARWGGFKQLAEVRADRDTLAVEMFRTATDGTVSIVTVVQDGLPVRYEVQGDALGNLKPAAGAIAPLTRPSDTQEDPVDGTVDPASVSIGRPPPQVPIPPGVSASAAGGLAAAFRTGDGANDSPSLTPPSGADLSTTARLTPHSDAEPAAGQMTLSDELRDVQLARWEGFKRLAKLRPNHDTLAVEMFRTATNTTVAIVTVVQDGLPVRYEVLGDGLGNLRTAADAAAARVTPLDSPEDSGDGAVDLAGMSSGRPPPQVPIPPGVTVGAAGDLALAFGGSATSDASPPN